MMEWGHVCFMVADVEEAKKLWIDVLGFQIMAEKVIPDATTPDGPADNEFFDQQTLDDIFHVKNSKSIMVLMRNEDGVTIELEQSLNPAPKLTPKEELQYVNTGTHEVAFNVENIEEWFEKIKAAGYETQTPYVWYAKATKCKSFLFYDKEGNMIQFCEVGV